MSIYEWTIVMEGPVDTPYEEGLFKAELIFPIDFPNRPPTMRFISPMWHPNSSTNGLCPNVVFANGCVCISILHPPGTDDLDVQEPEDEKWRPIISVEAILLSVQNMLTDPNENSPANLDAAVFLD
ncbi:uncharacterized protein [Blastocystis hominis]|uniref:UBC core domain-containing protein n=1 Tax=Blastocystis hominis TaxID=12968 RepID=D8LY19_BLAHO|nr:uncharacterized protein [Blastocystis hominis]CBK20474.2 unnamed protein product [Blastocystis hominis]|eukprot:XP_012894522.1 uncharacterized protein [Blastocystis hominis]